MAASHSQMLGQGIIGKGGAVYGLLPDGQDAQSRSLETPVINAPSPLHSSNGHHASYTQSLQTPSIRGS